MKIKNVVFGLGIFGLAGMFVTSQALAKDSLSAVFDVVYEKEANTELKDAKPTNVEMTEKTLNIEYKNTEKGHERDARFILKIPKTFVDKIKSKGEKIRVNHLNTDLYAKVEIFFADHGHFHSHDLYRKEVEGTKPEIVLVSYNTESKVLEGEFEFLAVTKGHDNKEDTSKWNSSKGKDGEKLYILHVQKGTFKVKVP